MIIAKSARIVAGFALLTVLAVAGCGGKTSHKAYAQRAGSSQVSERRAVMSEMRGKRVIDANLTPIVLLGTRDSDPVTRSYAYYALGRADPRVEGVVAAVITGISDSVADVRRAVVSAINEFDPFPSAVIPYMIKMLVDSDDGVRRHIVMAFVNLEGMGVISLVRQIDSKDPHLRMAIVTTLGEIGPPAKGALAKLKKIAAEDEYEEIRAAAGASVKKIER